MSTPFDPFRFDHKPGPEPVQGALPNVCLVDEEDDLDVQRPRWLKAFAFIVIGIFLGVTVLNAARQVTSVLFPSTDMPRASE